MEVQSQTQRQRRIRRLTRLAQLKRWARPTSYHHALQAAKGIDLCNRILQRFKQRQQFRRNVLPHVKNDKCFYSMEPYDKIKNPGPYFYHVQKDEKTEQVIAFEFDPALLADYIQTSNDGRNPFNKQPFNKVELMRLNRLAKWKNPRRQPINIERVLNRNADGERSFIGDEMDELLENVLHGLVLDHKERVEREDNWEGRSTDPQMQQLFQQDPTQMMEFLHSQLVIPGNQRDRSWFQFMTALTGFVARRFERVTAEGRATAEARGTPNGPRLVRMRIRTNPTSATDLATSATNWVTAIGSAPSSTNSNSWGNPLLRNFFSS